MSWIQENKFVAGLAGATAVIGGAILFFGLSQGSAYNKKLEKFEEVKAQYSKLEKSKPYPSAKNLRLREQGIADYEEGIKEVKDLILGYRPKEMKKITPEQFKDLQVAMENDLNKKFEESRTELPAGCLFGFEKYSKSSVRANATPQLSYELKAIQWLMGELATLKPEKIVNIRRSVLPEETGKVATQPSNPRRQVRGGNRSKLSSNKAYELMPFELTFTAREDVVRQFLVKVVNSKKYFYAIRSIRIRNEKQIAPNIKDANFPEEVAPDASDDGFGAIEGLLDTDESAVEEDSATPAEEGADATENNEEVVGVPTKVPEGELVLKEVLGSENLNVSILFDIVLIAEDKAALKQAKPTLPKR